MVLAVSLRGIWLPLTFNTISESTLGVIRMEVALPSFHSKSTVAPVRVRRPDTEPSFHCAGRAGRRVIDVWSLTEPPEKII